MSFVFLSCSDMKKGKQLEQIAAIQAILDSLQTEWDPEEARIIDSLAEECVSKIDSIGLLYDNQEIELVVASEIDLFKQSSTDLQELKKIHTFYPTVLKEKQQSLESLKKDISKGSGRREKYDEYIDFEQKELSTIRQQYDDYQETKYRCIKKYSASKGTVSELLDSLKSNQQNHQK